MVESKHILLGQEFPVQLFRICLQRVSGILFWNTRAIAAEDRTSGWMDGSVVWQ